jgi:prepilin-type N-terminal cleavage/methylation domain-containing protein
MYGRRTTRNRRGAGFTLVELLVVIGIIAVLIAMLMPALGKARAASRSLQCQTQLRTLYMAWQFYARDNRGYAVGGNWYAVTSGFPPVDPYQIAHYIKPYWTAISPWVMTCPDMPEVTANSPPLWGGTYCYNSFFWVKSNLFPPNERWCKITSVPELYQKIVFADGVGFTITANYVGYDLGDYAYPRHGGTRSGDPWVITKRRVNCVFGDGHGELIEWTPACVSPSMDLGTKYVRIVMPGQ